MKQLLFVFHFLAVLSMATAQVRPLHTVVLVLENHSYSQVVGNPLVPYINSLVNDPYAAVFTNSHAVAHPSQPNYIELFSGSAQGVMTDFVPSGIPFTTPNLGAALIQQKFSFTGFAEGLPATGSTDSSAGDYKRKHNPWVNWQGPGINGIPPEQNKPFAMFPADFSSLPTVSFVIPDQAHDMHDGGMAISFPACDTWLNNNLDNYIQWCKTHNSLFILTFDEDNGINGNNILTLIIGEQVKGGIYDQPITHHNLLRTIADLYKIPPPGASNDSSVIKHIWATVPVCAGSSTGISSSITGTNYQWQVNSGSGFVNISNNTFYSGTNTASIQLNNVPSSWYGYQYRCVVDGMNSNTVTLRFINYFTGTVSRSWENPLNWSCGSLPDSNTDVVITSAHLLDLNSIVTVRSFTLSGGAKFTALTNRKLTLTH